MKTPEQIVDFIECSRAYDPFGFGCQILLPYLTFDKAKAFLEPGQLVAQENFWKQQGWPQQQDAEDITREMQQYMEFAWQKCLGHRGISAHGNVVKMAAWLFLLGNDELVDICINEDKYNPYGAPILAHICEAMKWEMPATPEAMNMIHGKPCFEECEGCTG